MTDETNAKLERLSAQMSLPATRHDVAELAILLGRTLSAINGTGIALMRMQRLDLLRLATAPSVEAQMDVIRQSSEAVDTAMDRVRATADKVEEYLKARGLDVDPES